MAELKTKATTQSVFSFLNSVGPENKKAEGYTLLKMFEDITKEKAVMWGTSIVGFGKYHYKSERSDQEGDWPLVGFSPRKTSLTLYVMNGFPEADALLSKLGKHKRSVGCLYINKLSDVDEKILRDIIKKSYHHMKKTHKAI